PIAADFIQGCNGDLSKEIERVKDEVRVAHALGSPGIRHDAAHGFPEGHAGAKSFDTALARITEGCLAVTEFAATLGVRTMVENHGYFCQDSERVEKLICAVNHPNFGALIDIGNFACADEDCPKAIGRLVPYAFHVHVKDFHMKSGTQLFPGEGWFKSRAGNYLRGAIIGHGDIPVTQCLNVLKDGGYTGPLSIEFEGMEDPIQGITLGLQNLRNMLAATY
ncbi:MAG: sugar phosphate isomerase/epimerase, partial [Candidatus Hydrogenedentes bacterium]|nr:sugar phosphate isomerase/epimerase [Candidatus Hydrogenedentota bacterium]